MAGDWRRAEHSFDHPVIGMSTMAEVFEAAAERHADRPAQCYKGGIYDRSIAGAVVPPAPDGEFASIQYGEMRAIVRRLAAGLRTLGVENGRRVAVFSPTRMEWALSDFAVLAAGGVVTTVYSGSSERQVHYLLDDPGAAGVFVADADHLDRVLAVEADLELDFIVSFDAIDGHTAADRDDVYTLAEIHALGDERYDPAEYRSWLDEVDIEDLCSLIYTSGTTGQPKGVKLTHRNFRANVNQVYARFGPRPDKPADLPVIDETSRAVSFLPLAHVYERTTGHFVNFAAGATVAYAESPDTLREDFDLVEPTTATSVPRVYEKIYDAIREQASDSAMKERIFHWAVGVGQDYHRTTDPSAGLRAKRWLADRLVFSQVKAALGGNLEMLFSGGGSLSAELCALYHGMGLRVLEGYGLTETAPVVTTNPAEEPKIGTIGPPVVDQEIRIDEDAVPQSEFEGEGSVGELLVAGPNVSPGYWEMPDATAESFFEDDDGRWFRTGDVMHHRPDGHLEFRERLKQILVLSTGKNVAPAPIEDAFAASEVIEQAMVLGDGRKFVSALVVPNLEHLEAWAEFEGIDLPDDPADVCEDERVIDYVGREIDRVNEGFEAHETIKQFRLVPVEFTEDNDLLTPTMKKKRRNILDRFADRIEAMYQEADPEAAEA